MYYNYPNLVDLEIFAEQWEDMQEALEEMEELNHD